MSSSRFPYPGLRAFRRDESDLFFGREGCVDAMVDRFAQTRFLAVLGASGSGKSSLVRTGLLDALELGLHARAGCRWMVADSHPGGQPIRNLATALFQAQSGSSPKEMDVDLLTSFLRHGPRSVIEWTSGGNVPRGTNLLLLVDQFEELFRYGDYARREEAEAFVALLIESAASAEGNIHVVITMRSEYLGACSLMEGLAERINVGLYLAPRMSREDCRAAIEGPASVIGFDVEPALVNRLLNDLATFAPWLIGAGGSQTELLSRRADQLPLMQHVLNRLWVRAAGSEGDSRIALKLADYEAIGGLSGALDSHGAEIMARLGRGRASGVEEIFRALVSGTSPAMAVRRPARLEELTALLGGARDEVVTIVDAFRASDCNFLRTSDEVLDHDDEIVDISHESLIRQWTPLTEWVTREADDGASWRGLVLAERRFSKREGGLLTGLDLQSITEWWNETQPTRTWAARHGGRFEAASKFLDASRRAEEERVDAERQVKTRERIRLRRQGVLFGAAILLGAYFGITFVGPPVISGDLPPAAAPLNSRTTFSFFSNQSRNADEIERKYRHSWDHFENGRVEDGARVLDELQKAIGSYDPRAASPNLLMSYARVENLQSRYLEEIGKTAESIQHLRKAADLASDAVALERSMRAMRLEFELRRNLAARTRGSERVQQRAAACRVADSMFRLNPLDVHAREARERCSPEHSAP